MSIPFIVVFLFLLPVTHDALAADCSNVTPEGNLSITTGCMFTGTVNGVDAGVGSTNSANLAVSPGGTLTVGSGQTVAMGSLSLSGGSVVIVDGGSLRFGTPLWMTDADSDGLPQSTAQIAQTTQPVDGRRRNQLSTMAVVDQADTQYCPSTFDPSGACNKCVNGSIAAQNDGEDLFSECSTFYKCNGSNACTLHAKRVFVSSGTTRGDTGGLGGADSTCQNKATTVNLGGTWKAWLSSTTTSAESRLSHATVPYILVDLSTKIANDWNDIVDGTIDAPINKDESKNTVSSTAWTNTTPSGNIVNQTSSTTCNGWTSNSSSVSGRFGSTTQSDGSWTNSTTSACNSNRKLYCFEQ